MRKLPIGTSTLENIINDNCVYIDKTQFVAQLADAGRYYFLSRPRRFGKSLLIDTFKQAFLGNKDLFNGLYLEKNWDWDKKHPVIHISFSKGNFSADAELDKSIEAALGRHAEQYGITLKEKTHGERFAELIDALHKKTNEQVVILVDEYDKPILDAIDDFEKAKLNREILKGFYGTIKDCDSFLRFVFLTGVTKFSKVGLFSGLNNLDDITLDKRYADICGYTQTDLEREFKAYLSEGDVDKAKLKLWYNGYNFAGTEHQKVYNPFDILLFFSKNCEYRNYWFETGNPSFLIKLLQKNKYYFPDMENVTITDNALSNFDIDQMPLTPLLFQSGYLTIHAITTIGTQYAYVLGYPNAEVKASLNAVLTNIGTTIEQGAMLGNKLYICLTNNTLDDMKDIFQSHFSSIPHDWYRNNDIQHYEGFYASIVYSYFCALGYTVIAEDNTNRGQMDLTIILPDKIIILEFKPKKNGDAQSALQQIKNKNYAQKYISEKKSIYLIGMSFDSDTRSVYEFLSEAY